MNEHERLAQLESDRDTTGLAALVADLCSGPEYRSGTPIDFYLIDIAKALGDIGGAGAIAPLTGLLSRPEARVRAAAVIALLRLGDPEAVKRGYEAMLKELAEYNRNFGRSAIQALCAIGGWRSVAGLAAIFHMDRACNEDTTMLGSEVVWALSAIRDESAIEQLVFALEDDYEEVGRSAGQALAGIGGPAVGPLMEALNGDRWAGRYGARKEAASALLAIREAGGLGQVQRDAIISVLSAAASQSDDPRNHDDRRVHTDVTPHCGPHEDDDHHADQRFFLTEEPEARLEVVADD